ncbi:MAG: ABC transporter ATP-binding protein [Planctomycetota bacterium]|nr:MAG: ABC transporter ATP-binding protein [Planctomycetota bacterium]
MSAPSRPAETVANTQPHGDAHQTAPLLSVRNLTVGFRTEGGLRSVLDDVSFDVFSGETVGLVGESGCGKTVTSKAIMRLLPHTAVIADGSRILFDGTDLARADERTMQRIRGDRIAMVFQEPMTALNPVFRIGWQLDEALRLHTDLSRRARRARALEMLQRVELPDPEACLRRYPHELSGGMRQRVMIAMALCCEPDLLIADEPTTALDVTIQAQILSLLRQLQQRYRLAVLLITHDLGVVAQVCDRVLVMYAGQIVEAAPTEALFHSPKHPYTAALIQSVPKLRAPRHSRLPAIPGRVPSPEEWPSGCRFQNRCAYCQDLCRTQPPELIGTQCTHSVRCHFPLDGDPPT